MIKWICLFFLFMSTIRLYAVDYTRALWVTRWDYRSLKDIDTIMKYASDLGFNTILFQVRGKGTVTFPSEIELQSEQFRESNLNVLSEAIDSAHAYGMQLHAWINVFPGWGGEELPTNENQLYLTHPTWFMHDVFGRPKELHKNYLFLTPTHPHVRAYLQSLCKEIYMDYDIDGIHFDYIRFPASTYSYDPVSVALFEKSAGAKPEERPLAWQLWRQKSITTLLHAIHKDIKFNQPHIILSAAVVSDIALARDIYFQDGSDWLARGIIDALYPMLYSDENQVFKRELDEYILNSHGRHVYPGIAVKKNGFFEKLLIAQESGAQGAAIFSYSELVNSTPINSALQAAADTLWPQEAAPARMPWKIYTKDNLGPVFSQIQTMPSPLTPYAPFKIAIKITDPSGVYDDLTGRDGQGIYIECAAEWPADDPDYMTLSKVDKTKDWYICDDFLPGQPIGSILHARIYAHDNYHESLNRPKRNSGHSTIAHIPVVQPRSSYEYSGDIGPILWKPGAIAVDSLHQIWVTENSGSSVVIMDSTGKPLDYSPLRIGMNGDYKAVSLTKIVGFATDAFHNILIACNTNPPIIFRFDIQDGEPLPGISINTAIDQPDTLRAFTTDSHGHIYLLEKGSARWFILSPTGNDIKGMPYGDPQKTASDIAVLGNGAMVFLTDRTSNTVQCWYGAIEENYSQYWWANDFIKSTSGLGKIFIGKDDHIFFPNKRYGYIAEYDRAGVLLGHIMEKNSKPFAPQAVAFSKNGRCLYITHAVGEGPDRVKKWTKKCRTQE